LRLTFAHISAMLVVNTCCLLHNFVRQRDGFHFQVTLKECLLEGVKAVGNVTGTTVPFTHTLQYHIARCQTRASPYAFCRGESGIRYCTSSSHRISVSLISLTFR